MAMTRFWSGLLLWRSGSFLRRPSSTHALAIRCWRDIIRFSHDKVWCPVLGSLHAPSIEGLLRVCNPSAILRAIAKRVVFSFDGKMGLVPIRQRPVSKLFVAIPLSAHLYPASTITGIRAIRAPLPNTLPSRIKAVFFMRRPMLRCPLSGQFNFQATTRLAIAARQILTARNKRVAARTQTFPVNTTLLTRLRPNPGMKFDHREPSKHNPCAVYKIWHLASHVNYTANSYHAQHMMERAYAIAGGYSRAPTEGQTA